MFKITDVKLEFIANVDMYLSIEKGIWGGLRYIVQK